MLAEVHFASKRSSTERRRASDAGCAGAGAAALPKVTAGDDGAGLPEVTGISQLVGASPSNAFKAFDTTAFVARSTKRSLSDGRRWEIIYHNPALGDQPETCGKEEQLRRSKYEFLVLARSIRKQVVGHTTRSQ